MRLSIIIVNYNVRHFLEQALLSVRQACRPIEAEVWVVDNHSVDDSVEMVRERFPEVKLIANEENVGFSRANNQALRQAQGEYLLLLNPDTVVEEDTFVKCLDFMDAHPEAGALGVRMIDGSGKFLPESKRGFPNPWVAFCKTFGLSTLFPRSPLFNRYHLGYLDPEQVHEIDVISGAFMLMRRSVLEEVGLLDETFFMYGEDIDLSYRIQQAGYKNYYFPHTRIIHYKGESTKKGTLNYVRTFYQAMIIFARKHFRGEKAGLFIAMLRAAIYLRAALTLLTNLSRRLALPLLDASLLLGGLYFLKDFWGGFYFDDPDYFRGRFMRFNAPLYTACWLLSIYFSGGYDYPSQLRRLLRGMLFGTLLLAALYGFLEPEYRNSRALIILGLLWGLPALSGLRVLRHYRRHRNLDLSRSRPRNLVIVGREDESRRVRQLLQEAEVSHNFIGNVSPGPHFDHKHYLSSVDSLHEIAHIYQVDEFIFCSRDLRTQVILDWMSRLGPGYSYKILPEDSLSIIGSHSRNAAGELYTIDLQLRIAEPLQRRNKRLLDLLLSLAFLLSFPLSCLAVARKVGFWKNSWSVLTGKKTWVGYAGEESGRHLPSLRPGVLSPTDALRIERFNPPTLQRLDLLYAKDYSIWRDLEVVWKGKRRLGSPPSDDSKSSDG